MVKVVLQKNREVYQCEACGFHYSEEALAKQCEAWCTAHNSCNMEITKHAVENQKIINP